jgi:hypothetical protein
MLARPHVSPRSRPPPKPTPFSRGGRTSAFALDLDDDDSEPDSEVRDATPLSSAGPATPSAALQAQPDSDEAEDDYAYASSSEEAGLPQIPVVQEAAAKEAPTREVGMPRGAASSPPVRAPPVLQEQGPSPSRPKSSASSGVPLRATGVPPRITAGVEPLTARAVESERSPSMPSKLLVSPPHAMENGAGAAAANPMDEMAQEDLVDVYRELFMRRNRINAALVRIQTRCREMADDEGMEVDFTDGNIIFTRRSFRQFGVQFQPGTATPGNQRQQSPQERPVDYVRAEVVRAPSVSSVDDEPPPSVRSARPTGPRTEVLDRHHLTTKPPAKPTSTALAARVVPQTNRRTPEEHGGDDESPPPVPPPAAARTRYLANQHRAPSPTSSTFDDETDYDEEHDDYTPSPRHDDDFAPHDDDDDTEGDFTDDLDDADQRDDGYDSDNLSPPPARLIPRATAVRHADPIPASGGAVRRDGAVFSFKPIVKPTAASGALIRTSVSPPSSNARSRSESIPTEQSRVPIRQLHITDSARNGVVRAVGPRPDQTALAARPPRAVVSTTVGSKPFTFTPLSAKLPSAAAAAQRRSY